MGYAHIPKGGFVRYLKGGPMGSINFGAQVVAVATVLSVFLFGVGSAHAESTSESVGQVAVDETGNERSAVPTEDGLKLNTAPGDTVSLDNDVASWTDLDGNIIASIELDDEGDSDTKFRFDEESQTISAESATEKNLPEGMVVQAACMPKWVAWAFNITWGGLVCIPASLAASGVATPIAGIATGAACEAAGGAMVTAVSC